MSVLSQIPWRLLAPLIVAAVALYLLLPKPKRRPVLIASLLGVAALAAAGILISRNANWAPIPERVLFYTFSALALGGSAAMLTQRDPARAAICFALVVMNVCGLFLLQGAPFLMAATLIIYAGAIIVTFLFVLMLAQQRGFSNADDRTREPFIATLAGFVLLGTLLIAIDRSHPDMTEFEALVDKVASLDSKEPVEQIDRRLGDWPTFRVQLEEQHRKLKGSSTVGPGDGDNRIHHLGETIEGLREAFEVRKPADRNEALVKQRLAEFVAVGRRIVAESRSKPLPAGNVAGLGERLYSRYLLPVEIGGTLLLVATIGAIAIAGRRSEKAV